MRAPEGAETGTDGGQFLRFSAAASQTAASAKLNAAFRLGMVTPNIYQAISSQRTSGAAMICSSSWSADSPVVSFPAQVEGPSQNPRSIPE